MDHVVVCAENTVRHISKFKGLQESTHGGRDTDQRRRGYFGLKVHLYTDKSNQIENPSCRRGIPIIPSQTHLWRRGGCCGRIAEERTLEPRDGRALVRRKLGGISTPSTSFMKSIGDPTCSVAGQ